MALPNAKFGKATVVPDTTGFVDNFLLEIDLSLQKQEWWNDVNTTDATRGRASKDDGNVELSTVWIEFNKTTQTGRLIVGWTGAILDGATVIRIYAPNTRNEPVLNTDTFGSFACLDLANTFLYSPNGGNDDRSSNAFVLVEENGVVSGDAIGQIGAATDYNGVDEFVSSSMVDEDPPLTFMVWNNSDTSKGQTIFQMGELISGRIAIDKRVSNDFSAVVSSSGSNVVTTTTTVPNGTWGHVSAVFADTSSLEIYLNGVLEDSLSTVSRNPTNVIVSIGAAVSGTPALYFDGRIQEVFAFTDVKTDAWINFSYLQTNNNASFWTEWTFANEDSDFCIRAVSRLIEQFEQKINITKYLCALITPFDDLKEVFDDLQFKRNLNTAEGAQLDGLGELIGLARGGLSDDDYRLALDAQIVINASNGEVESIIAAMLVFAGGTFVDLIELYPAGIIVVSDGTVPTNIIQLLEQVAQAGIRLEVYATFGETPFAFDGDSGDPPDASTEGFSEPNYAPDAGLGGSFVEKFS